MSGRARRIRSFVAIALPPAAREHLGRALEPLRGGSSGPGVRWLRPESWHITLRFLGDVERARLEALGEALRAGVVDFPAFDLRLRGIDTFPNGRRPRVLVTRAEAGAALDRLAQRVERLVVGCGLPGETRPFRAHLTLARFRGRPAPRLERLALRPEPSFRVDAVVLFRSTLRPEGAVYGELARCPLAPGPAQSRSGPAA